MRELVAQHVELAAVLVGLIVAAIALMVFLLRRRARPHATAPAAVSAPLTTARSAKLNGAALAGAVREAEAAGRTDELPVLYLSLAHYRIETGSMADAEELLRKSIRGASRAQQKEVHAQARLVLGDLAHKSGDLTTACEHWQIARALFHELKRRGDHEAVEMRMLRNGCPTDWVLTDF
jgi:hypothetical protein